MGPIRWYLKGLFPLKFTSVMFGVFLFLEWLTLYYNSVEEGLQEFVYLSFMLVNPFILLSAFLHVFRSKETTLFELSLLSSWRSIAVARIFSSLVYVLSFWALQSVLLFAVLHEMAVWLILTSLNSLINYVGLGLVVSLTSNRTSSIVLGSLVFFLFPFSSVVLLQNYLQYYIKYHISLSGPLAYLVYFLNPEATYVSRLLYPKLVDLQLSQGFAVSIVVSIVLIALYYFAFVRLQFKP